jgi:hypothetical protein
MMIKRGLIFFAESIKMGTTVATNALLERKGEPTVLALTKGLKVRMCSFRKDYLRLILRIGFAAYWQSVKTKTL